MKNMKRRIAGVILILLLAVIVLSPASFSAWADLTDENPDSVEVEESEGIIEGESDETTLDESDETTEEDSDETLAEENSDAEKIEIKSYDDISSCKVGDIILFGKYEQDGNQENGKEDIEWQVLRVEADRALVVSKYALDCQPYDTENKNVTWETCSLRSWLNNDFKNNAFSWEEQGMIPEVTVVNSGNSYYGTSGGNDTQDQIFCLSLNEIESLIGYNWYDDENKYGYGQKMIAEPTAYAIERGVYYSEITEDNYALLKDYRFDDSIKGRRGCRWWLRSPGFDNKNAGSIDCTGLAGEICGIFTTTHIIAVRPALFIDINSLERSEEELEESADLSLEEVEGDDNTAEASDIVTDEIKNDGNQIMDGDSSEKFENNDTNVNSEEENDISDGNSSEENTGGATDVTPEDTNVTAENKNEIVDEAGTN